MERKKSQTSIRSRAEYDEALKKIESLMEAKVGTQEGKRLDELVNAVKDYDHGEISEDPGPADGNLRNGNVHAVRIDRR